MNKDFWKYFNSFFSGNAVEERKRKYFLWKNKLNTTETNYADMTEEEIREKLKCTDKQWAFLEQRFYGSPEWNLLMYRLYASNFDNDLLEVYNAVKQQAKEGNSSAVKTFLDLQKEIKKRLKNFDDTDSKDTRLKLDI